MDIQLKRVYESPEESDGYRILTDRLWPRGISREKAALDLWAKDMAPSSELRKWFGHDPEKYEAFREKYLQELDHNPGKADFLSLVKSHLKEGRVTLLYGARDREHNQAVVLHHFLEKALS